MFLSKRFWMLCLWVVVSFVPAVAQMSYWVTPPYRFSMWPSVTSSTIPNAAGPYSVANGVYDESGNLLFYADQYAINNANGGVGALGDNIPNPQAPTEGHFITGTEIAIVPIPGTCRQYYVIYGKDNPTGSCPLMYIKVDASGATPVITYNGSPIYFPNPYPPNNIIVSQQAFVISGNAGADNIGVAISKIYTGTGATAKRWLYSCGSSGIVRNEISSAGISAGVVVASPATLGLASFPDFASYELELSWGGNYLAWTSSNANKVYVIQVNPTTGAFVANSLQIIPVAGAKGLEFSNATTNPKLYVSGTNGLSQVVLSPLAVTSVATGTYDLSNTYLEYGKNNRIYGVAPTYTAGNLTTTTLVGVNPTNNSLITTAAGFDSRYTVSGSYTANVFTLPDQIDGENYAYFSGYPDVTVSSMTINGLTGLGDCDNGGWTELPSCNPIALNLTYTNGPPTQYKIDLQSAPGCAPTADLNYVGAWTNGAPAANFDLRSLTDGGGNSLYNKTGLFLLSVSIKNACGTIHTYSKYFKVIAPLPAVVALEIYNYANSQVYLPASTNLSAPVNVGTSSIGFRINNSTGTITSMRVIVDDVHPLTGIVLKQIYDVTKTVNGVSNLTYENLNTYCVASGVWGFTPAFATPCSNPNPPYSGYTGYFAYTNGQMSYGHTFRLCVILGNACGTTSGCSYLYVNSVGNKAHAVAPSEMDVAAFSCVFAPNPVGSQATLHYEAPEAGAYVLEILDLTGRAVFQQSCMLMEGSGQVNLDFAALASGSYVYCLRRGADRVTGRFSKL